MRSYPTITTKYHGPTETRGSRITARLDGLRVSVPYPHHLNGGATAHAEAARALLAKHWPDWQHRLVAGHDDALGGYVFLVVPDQGEV